MICRRSPAAFALAATASLLALTACTAEPDDAPAEQTPGPSEPSPTDTATPEPAELNVPEYVTGLGFLPKHVGEPGGLYGFDENGEQTADLVLEVTLTEFEDDYVCEQPGGPEPEVGRFVRLTLDIDVRAPIEAGNEDAIYTPDNDYVYAWKADGEPVNPFLAYGMRIEDEAACLPEGAVFSDSMRPGDRVTGSYVLDLPEDAVYVGYSSAWVGNRTGNELDPDGGWVWALEEAS